MESTVPREIINPGGGFEENDWLTACEWRAADDEFREAGNLKIIEPANQSTFEALGEKFFDHSYNMSLRPLGSNLMFAGSLRLLLAGSQ
jgi:hypothetical protein